MHEIPMLVLRCGCEVPFKDNAQPVCPTHGPQGVASTRHMPKPRFRGTAKGPLVETMDLPPWAGVITGAQEK
jgi:hypothetical protein